MANKPDPPKSTQEAKSVASKLTKPQSSDPPRKPLVKLRASRRDQSDLNKKTRKRSKEEDEVDGSDHFDLGHEAFEDSVANKAAEIEREVEIFTQRPPSKRNRGQ